MSGRWSRILLCLATGLVVAPLAFPQSSTQATLIGQVVDKNGNPMPGVTVSISSPTVAISATGTVTDADGRYRIAPLPPGDEYIVVAELPGYAKVEVSPINLDPGKTTTQN
ncbi:MAG: carboxypeptidase-like regulatory domain-containing protein, partial [Acidobacteriota bacterium]